jgi:hypothetical protein
MQLASVGLGMRSECRCLHRRNYIFAEKFHSAGGRISGERNEFHPLRFPDNVEDTFFPVRISVLMEDESHGAMPQAVIVWRFAVGPPLN